ncbi:hypothetical protein BACUNI_02094 [Bacteroides uniformis ATCC 8492]|uniref:Uncharacterized protein n=1 Tax=Bacteroides uniformis (strain ATCC 8492 / DSM 6597 / CCUG 4942 / CIP 103695 / JCM 5828 / KCTC 5204 / NCTC 13054 / VPI 0061) TaxID=411479 RepID=A0ABC9NBC9_BACUC|nr:hypothetical protein BACUNI_02094 [Bacteroides uniformis ATCC 8492]
MNAVILAWYMINSTSKLNAPIIFFFCFTSKNLYYRF